MSDWEIVPQANTVTASDWSIVPDAVILKLTPAEEKAQKAAALKKMLVDDSFSTTRDVIKPIISGLGTAGQNIATTVTRGYAPKVDMREIVGMQDPNMIQRFVEGGAQYAPLAVAGPLGWMGDLAAGTAYGATQSPESPILGAGVGGGSNLAAGILSQLMQTSNPLVGLLARGALGGATGYGLTGTKEGAATGLGIGAFGPRALRRSGLLNPANEIIGKINPQEAQARYQAGIELGTPLHPGEATGRADISGEVGAMGKVGEGSQELARIREQRIADQQAAINRFKGQVSAEGGDYGRNIKNAAQEHINELEKLRSDEAAPHYKAAENDQIPQAELDKLLDVPRIKNTFSEVLEDQDLVHELGGQQPTGKTMIAMIENRIDGLLTKAHGKPYNAQQIENLQYAKDNLTKDYGDPRVQDVLKELYKNDPVFHATSLGIDTRSIKFLDTVKKRINRSAMLEKDKYTAGLIGNNADRITTIADQYSPEYKIARSKFERASPLVDEAKNSQLGRLANLSDTQLKNASKIIFDPAQTNIRVLQQLKTQIMRKDPAAWNGIVRNEIERLTKKGSYNAQNFYQEVLKNENQYNQFKMALDHNPEALTTLENMKLAWEHLKNPVAAGTEYQRSAQSTNAIRDSIGRLYQEITSIAGGKEEAKAIEYLHSPRWMADIQSANKIRNEKIRNAKLAEMMTKILPPTILNNLLQD